MWKPSTFKCSSDVKKNLMILSEIVSKNLKIFNDISNMNLFKIELLLKKYNDQINESRIVIDLFENII